MNKRGSYIIFLTILLSTMFFLVFAVIWASGEKAISSTTKNFGVLWGKSILAEYDQCLKDRYGLFGFHGNSFMVEEKLNNYKAFTFQQKSYIKDSWPQVSLEGFQFTQIENFEKQIIGAYSMGIRPIAFSQMGLSREEDVSYGNRKIVNQRIISSLPSEGKRNIINLKTFISTLSGGKKITDISSGGLTTSYIFSFFKDNQNDRDLGVTYFKNEIEYIISGELSDVQAKKTVNRQILLLRNGLNLKYLYSCPEKRESALAAAQLAMPGAGTVLTQALIMESWAFLEAQNDVKLLDGGKTVPLMKADEHWAISIENVLSQEFDYDEGGNNTVGSFVETEEKSNYIMPKKLEGLDYEEYLRILLGLISKDIKLLRMMDLIQINMKYCYLNWFCLRDYYVGLKFSLEVNGKIYEFEEKY